MIAKLEPPEYFLGVVIGQSPNKLFRQQRFPKSTMEVILVEYPSRKSEVEDKT